MYAMLRERWAQVDQSNLEEIKAYNRYARMVRKAFEESKEDE